MTDIKEAIRDLLKGDTTLLTLLGTPTAYPYQIFYKVPPKKPTLPEVVFWFEGSNEDEETDGALELNNVQMLLVSWGVTEVYDQIARRVKYVLHQKTVNSTAYISHTGWVSDVYDAEFNCWGRTDGYRIHDRRESA
ncbi:MAG: hypothetical protein WC683_03980 [bacterium]